MSDVQFDEQNMGIVKRPFENQAGSQGPRGIEGLVIKLGLAKDSDQAKYVMIGITLFFFLLAIGVALWSFGIIGKTTLPPSPVEPFPPRTGPVTSSI